MYEKMSWRTKWRINKFEGNYPFQTTQQLLTRGIKPYETVEFKGNCALNSGINSLLLPALVGTEPHPIDATYGCIGVGDSTVAASALQTGLQAATNHLWVLLDALPTVGVNELLEAEATFASAQANWAWNEICIGEVASGLPLDSANPTGGYALNRKVQALGTKASGTSWTANVTLNFS